MVVEVAADRHRGPQLDVVGLRARPPQRQRRHPVGLAEQHLLVEPLRLGLLPGPDRQAPQGVDGAPRGSLRQLDCAQKKGHSGTEVDGKATREHLVCWFFSDSKHTSMDRVPTCHLPLFCCFPWGTI